MPATALLTSEQYLALPDQHDKTGNGSPSDTAKKRKSTIDAFLAIGSATPACCELT